MGSSWNSRLSLSIFGQSHAPAIGMTLDGLPAGEAVDPDELNAFLARRAPGRFPWSTSRKEEDIPEILSGIINGKTCGAPLAAIIRNQNTRSADYAQMADIPRPGHADYTAHVKYGGHQDVAGGGHFSGRLTAALCIAGGVCKQILTRRGVTIAAHISMIGWDPGSTEHSADIESFGFEDPANIDRATLKSLLDMDFPVLDHAGGERMKTRIASAKESGDSLGGMIECAAIGLPAGLGDPIFGGMENRVSSLVFGIPAVRGVEFGAGMAAAAFLGSEHNDPFYFDKAGVVRTRTNRHGGVLGGITSGMPLTFRVSVKPTPSVALEQESVSLSRGESAVLAVRGRHDPCIVPRAVPCVEAVCAIAVLDAWIEVGLPQGG
ncbi:MAG: chorismate synthase [Oscillospiraceae bacterium]|nr:chorismate synthase [Oscillospiraceae bacterium]